MTAFYLGTYSTDTISVLGVGKPFVNLLYEMLKMVNEVFFNGTLTLCVKTLKNIGIEPLFLNYVM